MNEHRCLSIHPPTHPSVDRSIDPPTYPPSIHPSIHPDPSIHLPIDPFNHPSISSIHPTIHPSTVTFIHSSTAQSIYPSRPIHPLTHRSIHPTIHPYYSSIHRSIQPSIDPSIYPSIHPDPSIHSRIQPSVHLSINSVASCPVHEFNLLFTWNQYITHPAFLQSRTIRAPRLFITLNCGEPQRIEPNKPGHGRTRSSPHSVGI